MVTYGCGKPCHLAQEASTLPRILTFLVFSVLADGISCWDMISSLCSDFHLPVGVYGRMVHAAQVLGSFKGFLVVKSEVVVNEIEALCE